MEDEKTSFFDKYFCLTPSAYSILVEEAIPGNETMKYGHVAFIERIEGDRAYYSDNYGSDYFEISTWHNHRTDAAIGTCGRSIIHLQSPSIFEQSIDLVQCPGTNSLRVAGWVFNKENSSASIQVHVYIDAPAGSGTILGGINANLTSDDVNQVHGITGKHRFDYTFTNVPGGNHTFYFYAVDGDKNDIYFPS